MAVVTCKQELMRETCNADISHSLIRPYHHTVVVSRGMRCACTLLTWQGMSRCAPLSTLNSIRGTVCPAPPFVGWYLVSQSGGEPMSKRNSSRFLLDLLPARPLTRLWMVFFPDELCGVPSFLLCSHLHVRDSSVPAVTLCFRPPPSSFTHAVILEWRAGR